MTDPKLAAARLRAAAARAELDETVAELQFRLKPSTIAGEAKEAIVRKSTALADDAVDAVAKRPVAASATVAGIGALLGAGLFALRRRRHQETS